MGVVISAAHCLRTNISTWIISLVYSYTVCFTRARWVSMNGVRISSVNHCRWTTCADKYTRRGRALVPGLSRFPSFFRSSFCELCSGIRGTPRSTELLRGFFPSVGPREKIPSFLQRDTRLTSSLVPADRARSGDAVLVYQSPTPLPPYRRLLSSLTWTASATACIHLSIVVLRSGRSEEVNVGREI